MNALIVFLSIVGAAFAQWGHQAGPQETPEVAAARAAHLSALAAAGGNVPAPAAPSWNSNPGVPQDTPEVAAAKAAHFAALAQAGNQGPQPNPAPQPWNDNGQWNNNNQWNDNNQWNNHNQWNNNNNNQWNSNSYAQRWNGPLALPPGFDASGAPLPVQDTPEVQAERAHHLALAARAGAPAPLYPSAAPAAPAYGGYPGAPAAAPAYGGYGAAPGAPADTPEVAAAKAAHFAAHQAAIGHRYKRSVLAAPLALAPWTIAHPAPLAIAHAPVLRHTILI